MIVHVYICVYIDVYIYIIFRCVYIGIWVCHLKGFVCKRNKFKYEDIVTLDWTATK